jgi:CBS domain-containing protein
MNNQIRYLAYINGMLALFNLIPGFPLDGGRIFRAIVWGTTHRLRQATLTAAYVGRFAAFLFIFVGVWQISGGDLGNGLWIAFTGWFLESAAFDQAQRQEILDQLAGHRVSEVMRRNYTTIPAATTLQQLVEHHLLDSRQHSFVVERDDDVAGLVTLRRIKEVPRDAWATAAVAQVMVPMTDLKWVRPDTDLWAALDQMDHDGVNQLLVMVDQHIQGMLTRDSIISLLRAMRELDLQFD